MYPLLPFVRSGARLVQTVPHGRNTPGEEKTMWRHRKELPSEITQNGARGWGPFTGRQLTVIIVAVIAIFLVPTAAVAVEATNVVIESTTGTKAGVTPPGNLKTAVAAPSAFFNPDLVTVTSSTLVPVATPPSGDALVVTNIHIDPYAAGEIEITLHSPSCSSGPINGYGDQIQIPATGDITIPLDPGAIVPSGDVLCGGVFNSAGADVQISGYTIPASAA